MPLQRLSNVTAELQDGVMKTRMQPIGNAWQKLPRIVRDLSAELGKDIELEMHGADTELDRQVLERIKDPLTHMVRNSADHGLESRADRIAAGKPEKGTIRLSAYHEGGHIIIGIADDGRGLDTERIRDKALASGLATEAELDKMSEAQIQQVHLRARLLDRREGHQRFRPRRRHGRGAQQHRSDRRQHRRAVGAGRGPELHHQDSADARDHLGADRRGGRRALRDPAAFRGRAGARARPSPSTASSASRTRAVLRLRNKLLPLVRLGEPAEARRRRGDPGKGLHRRDAGRRAELRHRGRRRVPHRGNRREADGDQAAPHRHVLRQHHSRRRLGDHDHRSERRVAGGRRSVAPPHAPRRPKPRPSARAAADKTVSLLVFRAGSPEPKAVPLSLVTRLEEIDCRKIELSNGRHMVQYRGQLMPLVRVSDEVSIKREGAQPLLVFSDGGRSMGLVVDEIVDIVEDKLDIQVGSDRAGVLGSAVVAGQATEIIDVGHFLPLAFEDWFRRKDVPRRRAARARCCSSTTSAFFRNMLSPVLQGRGLRGDRRRRARRRR